MHGDVPLNDVGKGSLNYSSKLNTRRPLEGLYPAHKLIREHGVRVPCPPKVAGLI